MSELENSKPWTFFYLSRIVLFPLEKKEQKTDLSLPMMKNSGCSYIQNQGCSTTNALIPLFKYYSKLQQRWQPVAVKMSGYNNYKKP